MSRRYLALAGRTCVIQMGLTISVLQARVLDLGFHRTTRTVGGDARSGENIAMELISYVCEFNLHRVNIMTIIITSCAQGIFPNSRSGAVHRESAIDLYRAAAVFINRVSRHCFFTVRSLANARQNYITPTWPAIYNNIIRPVKYDRQTRVLSHALHIIYIKNYLYITSIQYILYSSFFGKTYDGDQ